jgi:membrane-associated protein
MSLEHINLWLMTYKYWILFPMVVVEGPIITVVIGYLATLGMMNFFIAYPIIIAGDLTGDVIYYYLGKKAGRGILKRTFFIPKSLIKEADKLKGRFKNNGGKILISGKMLHGIGAAFLFAAGMAEMPMSSFLFYNLISTAIKSLLLFILGFFFGQAILAISKTLQDVAILTTIGGIALLVAYLLYTYFKKKNAKN